MLWITTADGRIEQIRTTGKTGILPPRCWQAPASWEAEAESSQAHEFKASPRNMRPCPTPIKNYISKFLKSYHQKAIEEILCSQDVTRYSLVPVPMPPSPTLPSFLSTLLQGLHSGSHPTWNHTCFLLGATVSSAATPIKGIKRIKVSLRGHTSLMTGPATEDPSCFSREDIERAKMVSLPLSHSDNETAQHHPESLQGRQRACPSDRIPSVVGSGRHRLA